MATIQTILTEIQGYETSVGRLYQTGTRIAAAGRMPPALAAEIERHGAQLYMLQRAVYDTIIAVMETNPASAAFTSQIPAPVRYPAPWAAPSPPEVAGLGALGALPVLAWAAIVVAAIAAIAAIAWVLTEVVATGTELVATIVEQWEQTKRYNACLTQNSQNPEACVSIAPPQQRPQGMPAWGWWLIGIGSAVALGAVGYTVWKRRGTIKGLTPYAGVGNARQLSGTSLRRALGGGYNMEV